MNHAHHTAAALLLALLVIIAGASLFLNPRTVSGVSHSVPITGYAWSDNIGWISFSCVNGGPNGSNICGTFPYGLVVASNGNISGYAWSDSIGWVTANASEMSGCPSTPCTAKITTSQVSGWLKALAGGSAQSGGWDGWISLSGSSPSYGVTKNPNGTFTGYAWGSLVVGWVDFRYAKTDYSVCTPSTDYTCSPTSGWDSGDKSTIIKTDTNEYCAKTETRKVCNKTKFCSRGIPTCLQSAPTITKHLQAIPLLVQKGGTTKLYWDIRNIKSCSISGSNGDSWSEGGAGCDGTRCTAGSGKTSRAINQRVVYTMTCTQMDNTTFTETATVSVSPVFQER